MDSLSLRSAVSALSDFEQEAMLKLEGLSNGDLESAVGGLTPKCKKILGLCGGGLAAVGLVTGAILLSRGGKRGNPPKEHTAEPRWAGVNSDEPPRPPEEMWFLEALDGAYDDLTVRSMISRQIL